jgi:peroxidase
MDRKPSTRQLLLFLLATATPFASLFAQRDRETKGRLLMTEQAPRTEAVQASLIKIHPVFRTYDGKFNNLNVNKINWGAADIILFRDMPAFYGPTDPNNAMGGVNRPSPRAISNAVIDEPVTQFNTRHLSTLVYQWGQFLDHEITLTPTGSTEYVPIALPTNEVIFTEAIPFFRSEFRTLPGSSVRQQINLATSFIDGSVVYGSDATRAKWLRTGFNGKLKTSAGNLMPYNTIDGELGSAIDPLAPSMANDSGGAVKTFVAGDVRAAENPVLTSIHTLFVREHNRICDQLLKLGLRNDELIYQLARKEVGAEIAAITYQEFLPAMGIQLSPFRGYNENTRPDITNNFATGSFRLGHTMVSDDVILADNDCEEVGPGEMELVDVFWTPSLVQTYGIEIWIKGASSHDQYETDNKINDVLRNFLFVSASSPVRFGIDLGSLNIQRGRDHGLPDYNKARLFYTGTTAKSFSDISPVDSIARALKQLYGSVDNVDLWVGILAEKHLPNKSVGLTLNAMLKSQFEKLRDGDFYFYLNDPYLTDQAKQRIKSTTFADIIKRNTQLTNVPHPFITDSCHNEESAAAVVSRVAPVRSANEDGIIRVFPNPANDQLTVDLGTAFDGATIKIFSSTGELVRSSTINKQQRLNQITVRDLPAGLYVVNVTTKKGVRSISFTKL